MKHLRVICCTLALSTAAASVWATVLVPADLTELTTSAAVVVQGRVLALTPQWREQRRGIETVVTIEVLDCYKGTAGREVEFKIPGGQMGPYRSVMVGTPTFREGDEVIVFLSPGGSVIPHLVGFSQGVFRVTGDASGARVVRGGTGRPDGGSERLTRGTSLPIPLAEFAARIRHLAGGGGR